MTYQYPNVTLNEVLKGFSQTLNDADLKPCAVGALYQVVKKSKITLPFKVTNSTIVYPSIKIGAIIDTGSVSISVDSAEVEVKASTVIAVGVLEAGKNTATLTDAFAGALAGDIIIHELASGVVAGTYTIKSRTDASNVVLNETIDYSNVATDKLYIKRNVGNIKATLGSPTYDLSSVTITSLTYNSLPIISGTAYISYRAIRKDLLGFYNVDSIEQLKVDMDIDPLNPLGFYLGSIMPTASGGRKCIAYILPDESDLSFASAYDSLSTNGNIYYMVPLSTSSVIMNSMSSHVTNMSSEENSMFRTAIINTPLVTEKIMASGTYTK